MLDTEKQIKKRRKRNENMKYKNIFKFEKFFLKYSYFKFLWYNYKKIIYRKNMQISAFEEIRWYKNCNKKKKIYSNNL